MPKQVGKIEVYSLLVRTENHTFNKISNNYSFSFCTNVSRIKLRWWLECGQS